MRIRVEAATIDSRHDLFDVMVEAKVLVVKFVSTAHHPLQWAFHRDTGQALQAIAADPVDSELVSMSRTLGAMMNRAAVPALSHLCDHQQYFVRWAAMQALGYVAPELLVPRLKVAEEDPHPEVSPHFFLRDQALVASRRGRRCAHGARFKVTKPEKSANHARQRSIAEVPV
ncbi:HEAT repeat domain-containing protein [Xanthomonas oryzae]|uniref:HEAT repeat domain-containing protein n=1 Tax=Xanthomonas oryzae TaxID=347 RepID=UPI001651F589|nr:HEAT repeat domain-containing protein [Xanthomonas oryzae]